MIKIRQIPMMSNQDAQKICATTVRNGLRASKGVTNVCAHTIAVNFEVGERNDGGYVGRPSEGSNGASRAETKHTVMGGQV